MTGHAYWHAAIAAAALDAAWFATSHVLHHFRAPRQRHKLLGPALPALQVAVFVGMEVSERLADGAPVATIFDHAPVGLASQLLVAAVLTVAVYLIGRGAAAAGRLYLPIPPEDRRDAFAVAPLDFLPARLTIVPCGSRGPPFS